MSKDCLPEHLKNSKHNDFLPGLRWIPRSWTAFCWGKPIMVWGNQIKRAEGGHPKPIGEPGSWQVSIYPNSPLGWTWAAWYVAFTFPSGRHFRIGARWDDVDNYVEWPSLATRFYPVEGERDTSVF